MLAPANDRLSGPYACTGGETVFPYDFKITAASDLVVSRLRGGGVETLVLNTDYAVSGIGSDAFGNVLLAAPAVAGDKVVIYGDRPRQRVSDIVAHRALAPGIINPEYDNLQWQIQELRRDLDYALRRSLFDVSGGSDVLPASSASMLIGFDAAANVISIDPATLGSGGGGGSVGVIDVAHGGTGASTAGPARANLGLGSLATLSGVGSGEITDGSVAIADLSQAVLALLANPAPFATRAAAVAATIPAATPAIVLAGYAALGDMPPVVFTRAASAPAHPGYFQSADGAYWVIARDDHVDVRWCGAKVDGVTDDNQALLDAIAIAIAQGSRLVRMPAGNMKVSGSSIEISGVVIEGVDPNRSLILFSSNAASVIKLKLSGYNNGSPGYTGGGLRRLCVWASSGNCGYGVWMQGDATYQPDEAIFEDIKVTGSGSWDYPMFLNGGLRISGTLVGLRAVTMRNIFLGQANIRAMYTQCCEDLTVDKIGSFGGANRDVDVLGNSSVYARYNCFTAMDIQGSINLFNAQANSFYGFYFDHSVTGASARNAFVGCRNAGQLTTQTAGAIFYVA